MKRCNKCGYTNEDTAAKCVKCEAPLAGEHGANTPKPANSDRPQYRHSGHFEYPVPYQIYPSTVLQSDDEKQYSVVQFVAEGGFAKVFHAKGPKLAIGDVGNVAIKVMNLYELHPDQQKEFTKRFEREYQVGQINSDYIVRTFAKGFVTANPFMVMEYCPNGTLEHLIQSGRLLEEDIRRIAIRVLHGLHDLHQAAVVHRDLKPSNILFDENNEPRVADFGISAYIRNRMTQINRKGNLDSTLGTPYYCPPEQRKGTESVRLTNPRMDLYAFGVILYEAFSKGQFPFASPGEDIPIDEYYKRAEKGNWKDIRNYRNDLDPVWSKIITRCIAPKPEQRFESASEILELLGQKSESAPGPSPSTQPGTKQQGKLLLRVINGDEIGHTYYLNDLLRQKNITKLTIGWLNPVEPGNNDIGIFEKYTQYISSRHATIEVVRNGVSESWYIRDGQWYEKNNVVGWHRSKNGVLVNSQEADESGFPIYFNDIITIGDTKMKVEPY
ncbi:MAG TPA: protein kinase [Cyclobacteriaceae bacterium]|nr:protein kinase [Cyclobacteriaceae bacterium]